jgi:hypothetical protein
MSCAFPTKRTPFHHRYFGKVSQQVPLPEIDKNYRKNILHFIHCNRKKENYLKAEVNRSHSFKLKAYIREHLEKYMKKLLQSKKTSRISFRNTDNDAEIVKKSRVKYVSQHCHFIPFYFSKFLGHSSFYP